MKNYFVSSHQLFIEGKINYHAIDETKYLEQRAFVIKWKLHCHKIDEENILERRNFQKIKSVLFWNLWFVSYVYILQYLLGTPAGHWLWMHAYMCRRKISYSYISSFISLLNQLNTDFHLVGQADKTRAREKVHTAAINAKIARPCLSALPPFQCVKPGA